MKTHPAQPEMDFVYGLPSGMENFSVRFLARFFGTSEMHWIRQIESGALEAQDLRSPGVGKSMYRVNRLVLIAYLNKRRTA